MKVSLLQAATAESQRIFSCLDISEVLKLCSTSSAWRNLLIISLQKGGAHLYPTVRLTVQRYKHKDQAFIAIVSRLRMLQHLELHIPRHYAPRCQEPYYELLRRNVKSLCSLRLTAKDQLNAMEDLHALFSQCSNIGDFARLRSLEIPMGIITPLMLAKLTNLETLRLVGSAAPALEPDSFCCAFACLNNLKELKISSSPLMLRALVRLRENMPITTLLQDDGSLFGDMMRTPHKATRSFNKLQRRPASAPNYPTQPSRTEYMVIQRQSTAFFGIQGRISRPIGCPSIDRLPKLRVLCLHSYPFTGDSSFSSENFDSLLLEVMNNYPETTVMCENLCIDLSPSREPTAKGSIAIMRLLAPTAASLTVDCRQGASPRYDDPSTFNLLGPSRGHDANYPTLHFDSLKALNIGTDDSPEGVSLQWLLKQRFNNSPISSDNNNSDDFCNDTSSPISLHISLLQGKGTSEQLETSPLFSQLPSYNLTVSAVGPTEGLWHRTLYRILSNPGTRAKMKGFSCASMRDRDLPIVCLTLLQCFSRNNDQLGDDQVDEGEEYGLDRGDEAAASHSDLTLHAAPADGDRQRRSEVPTPQSKAAGDVMLLAIEGGGDCSPCRQCNSVVRNDGTDRLLDRRAPLMKHLLNDMPRVRTERFNYRSLRLPLPLEAQDWLLILLDLNPQLERVQVEAPASFSNPKTQTDEIRKALYFVTTAIKRRGFKLSVKVHTSRESTHLLDGSRQYEGGILVIDGIRDSPLSSSTQDEVSLDVGVACVPLTTIFRRLKASETHLLNLLDLYVEESLPLMGKPVGKPVANILDRVSWFFRRSQGVRVTLTEVRDLQRRCLRRIFGSGAAESTYIRSLVESQNIENDELPLGVRQQGCATCSPEFDWYLRQRTPYPPLGTKAKNLMDVYRHILDVYDEMCLETSSMTKLACLPAGVIARFSMTHVRNMNGWTDWLRCNLSSYFQPNDVCNRRKQKASGPFLHDISKDEVAKWCVHHLVKHHSVISKLLDNAGAPRPVAGCDGKYCATKLSSAECRLHIPVKFAAHSDEQHEITWVENKSSSGKGLFNVILTPTGLPRSESSPKKGLEMVPPLPEFCGPPSPAKKWRSHDVPQHGPYVMMVGGIDAQMHEEDVYNIFVPAIKPYNVKVVRDNQGLSLHQALVEFKTQAQLRRALLEYHGTQHAFPASWQAPTLFRIDLKLPGETKMYSSSTAPA